MQDDRRTRGNLTDDTNETARLAPWARLADAARVLRERGYGLGHWALTAIRP